MKPAQEYLHLSKERLLASNHILSITYPTLKSPRLFLSSLQHLFLSMDYAMNAMLSHELNNQSLESFPNTFSGRYSTFRLKIADKKGFERSQIKTLLEMRNILIEHEKSAIEFERVGKFVICSNSYETISLTEDLLMHYGEVADAFLKKVHSVLAEPLFTSELYHTQ